MKKKIAWELQLREVTIKIHRGSETLRFRLLQTNSTLSTSSTASTGAEVLIVCG
jgi:FixJ family two-component response regulator